MLGVGLLWLWRSRRFHDGLLFLVLLSCLHWILHPLHGSILPRVFACWIYLVGLALLWQQCFKQVFQFGSTFTWRDEITKRVSSHHLALLMRRYPNYCRGRLFEDINELCHQTFVLLGAQGLARVGPIDLVIAGWPCQGHTRAGCGEGLRDP